MCVGCHAPTLGPCGCDCPGCIKEAPASAELIGLTEKDWTVPALVKLINALLDVQDCSGRIPAAVAKARLIVATYYNA